MPGTIFPTTVAAIAVAIALQAPPSDAPGTAGGSPAPRAPSVHRAAFRDRAAMVLVDAGNGCWAAFNPRTASFDLVWRGEVDWRGKVFDFSQETSRPKGEVLLDRMSPIATIPDVVLAPGQTVAMRTRGTRADLWHLLLIAFDEQVRTPVTVRAVEADGTERVRFSSCTSVSGDAEWQWNFKAVRGPALPAAVEWTNEGTAPKPLRNLRLEGEAVAWTDRQGRALTVTWRGYEVSGEAVVLHFDLSDAAGHGAPVTQRVLADGTALRVETDGIPADSRWRTTLAEEPRSVRIGGTP